MELDEEEILIVVSCKYTTQWEGTFYRVTEQTECGSECFAKKVRYIALFAN